VRRCHARGQRPACAPPLLWTWIYFPRAVRRHAVAALARSCFFFFVPFFGALRDAQQPRSPCSHRPESQVRRAPKRYRQGFSSPVAAPGSTPAMAGFYVNNTSASPSDALRRPLLGDRLSRSTLVENVLGDSERRDGLRPPRPGPERTSLTFVFPSDRRGSERSSSTVLGRLTWGCRCVVPLDTTDRSLQRPRES